MKRVIAMLCGGVLAAGLGVGVSAQHADTHGQPGHGHAQSTEGKPVTVTGELIDTACYVASDGDAKGKDHAECAKECMGSGVPAGILPEGSKDANAMMFLLTNPTVLAPYASQTIKVEGKAFENMHAIDVQKLYVKDGDNWKEVQLKDAHHQMGKGGSDHGHHGHSDQKHGDK